MILEAETVSLLQNTPKLLQHIHQSLCSLLTSEEKPHSPSFYFPQQPTISLRQYLQRMGDHMHCSNAVFIVALIYLQRLKQHGQAISNHGCSLHKLFMITVVLAAKFLDDSFYKNTFYAKVAGFNSAELNQLELKFVLHTDFTLFVSPEDFKCALSTLSAH